MAIARKRDLSSIMELPQRCLIKRSNNSKRNEGDAHSPISTGKRWTLQITLIWSMHWRRTHKKQLLSQHDRWYYYISGIQRRQFCCNNKARTDQRNAIHFHQSKWCATQIIPWLGLQSSLFNRHWNHEANWYRLDSNTLWYYSAFWCKKDGNDSITEEWSNLCLTIQQLSLLWYVLYMSRQSLSYQLRSMSYGIDSVSNNGTLHFWVGASYELQ